MKKQFTFITSVFLATILLAQSGVNVGAEIGYEGAPVVYVDSYEELPESVRKLIEENDAYSPENQMKRRKQDAEFNAFINRLKSGRGESVAQRAIVTPTLTGLKQFPQETEFYCGYACLQSALNYHGIDKTQQEIASEAYKTTEGLAWFTGSEALATNANYYPASQYLNPCVGHNFAPYSTYFGDYTKEELSDLLLKNISTLREPVLICGISSHDTFEDSHLAGYPTTSDISHWIIVYGIKWNNEQQMVTEVSFRDPAKSNAISWSGSISASATVPLNKIYAFSCGHGIIC